MHFRIRHAIRLAALCLGISIKVTGPAATYYAWLAKIHGRRLHHSRHGYTIS